MVQRDVLARSREMPSNCRLAPGDPEALKCEEVFTRFEESSEVAYIKLASGRLTENQIAKTLWREQVQVRSEHKFFSSGGSESKFSFSWSIDTLFKLHRLGSDIIKSCAVTLLRLGQFPVSGSNIRRIV